MVHGDGRALVRSVKRSFGRDVLDTRTGELEARELDRIDPDEWHVGREHAPP